MSDMHGVGGLRMPCEECGNHLATVTVDLSGSVPQAHLCGLCALELVLAGWPAQNGTKAPTP